MRRLSLVLSLVAAACSGNDNESDSGSIVPAVDAPPGGGAIVDAPVSGGEIDAGGVTVVDAPPAQPRPDAAPIPDGGVRFLTAPPPYPDCPADINFKPEGGYSGRVGGQKFCGPNSPNCPTEYIPGNSGSPCTTAADCTGPNPVCLTGPKYPQGVCAATGCEYGSNFGCPAGDFCLNGGDGQTYCIDGCGIDETNCFKHCSRDGFSCVTSESKTIGYCLGTEGMRQCNPSESATCTGSFGDGVCGQSAWDDQTVGNCFETCDVFAQDCSKDGHGCYSLFEYPGYPVCFQSQGEPAGSSCVRTTECAEGLRCSCDNGSFPCTSEKHCRTYCSTNGRHPCTDPNTYCRPLEENGNLGSCEPKP